MQEMRLLPGRGLPDPPRGAAPHARRAALRARGGLLARARRRRPARGRLRAGGNDSSRDETGVRSAEARGSSVARESPCGVSPGRRSPPDADADAPPEALGRFRPAARRRPSRRPRLRRTARALSDVVRAAQEGRDGAAARPEKSGITIDNRSLVKNPDKGRVSTARPVPHARRTPAAATPAGEPGTVGRHASGGPADRGHRGRVAARSPAGTARRVADAKARVAELDRPPPSKLENDFYAWDDGQYRDRVIKPAWDRTRRELETAKQPARGGREGPRRSARDGRARPGPCRDGSANDATRPSSAPAPRRRTASRPGAAR